MDYHTKYNIGLWLMKNRWCCRESHLHFKYFLGNPYAPCPKVNHCTFNFFNKLGKIILSFKSNNEQS